MKNILIIIVVILAFITYDLEAKIQDSFCDGFEAGYIAGYCDENINCIEPATPACPMPNINGDDYQSGYNVGFKRGLQEKP